MSLVKTGFFRMTAYLCVLGSPYPLIVVRIACQFFVKVFFHNFPSVFRFINNQNGTVFTFLDVTNRSSEAFVLRIIKFELNMVTRGWISADILEKIRIIRLFFIISVYVSAIKHFFRANYFRTVFTSSIRYNH